VEAPAAVNAITQIPERAGAASCFGTPVQAGNRVAIPDAEVMYGLGVGWGGGEIEAEGREQEGSGGGAGGGMRSRGVAVIEVGPAGVTVHPIYDRTAIALAGIAFGSAALALALRALTRLLRH
jgi:uncharacterized spore protein YtfJ